MSNPASDLDDRWHEMLFGVRRSVRYHRHRQRFFEWLDRLVSVLCVAWVLVVIYGVFVATPEVAQRLVLAGLVIVMAIAVLYSIGGSPWLRMREHRGFVRRFVELEKRMNTPASDAVLRQVTHTRLKIEAEEPPVMRVLDCICHNELCQALGYPERAHIGFFQRLFAQVVDIRPDLILVKRDEAAV